jgi:hypothetical protein
VISGWLTRLREPRYGMVVFTTATALLMAAHWRPMLLPGGVLVVLALLRPDVAVRPYVWAAVAASWAGALFLHPGRMEDHVYLFVAWLVALAVALTEPDDHAFVQGAAWQARTLLGIVFTAAVGWKLAFGEFLDGSALWMFLLIDGRFGPLTAVVGLPDAAVDAQRAAIADLLAGTASSAALEAPRSVIPRIVVLAILTLLIEAMVAVSHLAGDHRRVAALRLPSLVAFAVLTYAVVPVLLFAALLAVLAMATAQWRADVLWVFPVFVLVPLVRTLTLG